MTTPQFTGIRLLTDNVEAWQAKRKLIAEAKHTLDLAYFIVNDDATTSRLLLDLVEAANRDVKVKVRLLVDYFMTYPQEDMLKALATKNIEVRRYRPPSPEWLTALQDAHIDQAKFVEGLTTSNIGILSEALYKNNVFPITLADEIKGIRVESGESRISLALRVLTMLNRQGSTAMSALEQVKEKLPLVGKVVGGLDKFLHRTHHKLLLADKKCFIMGGRNLADAYQRSDPPKGSAFQDTDVQACDNRPDDSKQAAGFNKLWDDSLPIDAKDDPLDAATLERELESLREKANEVATLKPNARSNWTRELPDMDGYFVDNLPSATGDPAITAEYVRRIQELKAGVIDIVSAYVCFEGKDSESEGKDSESGTLSRLYQALLDAAGRGVTVNIHTNSVASTDLRAVNQAAYQNLSKLIEGGVNVFELKEGQGSLHTKAAAIGDEWLMIGSYNMDPRSELYDTNNLIVLRDVQGKATRAFRNASVKSLAWTQLTADRAKQLAAEYEQQAARWALFKQVL